MSISELINALEEAKRTYGDIRVVDTQDTWNHYFDFYPEDFGLVKDPDNDNEVVLSLRGEY